MKFRRSIQLPGKSCAALEREHKKTQSKSKLTQNLKKIGLKRRYRLKKPNRVLDYKQGPKFSSLYCQSSCSNKHSASWSFVKPS